MFEFLKKKKDTKDPKTLSGTGNNSNDSMQKTAPNAPSLPKLEITEDQLMIMPAKYKPKKSGNSSSGSSSKLLWVVIPVILLLAGAAGVALYFYYFPEPQESAAPAILQPQQTPSTATSTPRQTSEPETLPQPRVLQTQVRDKNNVVVGTVTLTIPPEIDKQYGRSIGIAILDENDFELPEQAVVLGGLYSAFPVGVVFDEELTLELSTTESPAAQEEVSEDEYALAVLRGTRWQPIEQFTLTDSGLSATMSTLPNGPFAIVYEADVPESGTNELMVEEVVHSVDSDGDGLTDQEEELLGTSIISQDTDGDSYLDLAELQNGYSPTSTTQTLAESGFFSVYTNATYGYRIEYPFRWLADSLDQSNKQVLFISETEEFFEVLIEENPLGTPIVEWYRGQSPSLEGVALDVIAFEGVPAVWSPDHLTLFVGKDGLVYIMTYNKGTLDEIHWPNMFDHFYNSFTFGNTAPQEPATTETQSFSENETP